MALPTPPPPIMGLTTPGWDDYELLDSGNGLKLERYGDYRFVRPEEQAMWQPILRAQEWQNRHAEFEPVGEHGGWKFHQRVPERWQMHYDDIRFWAEPTPFRHLGVFPEQASHWAWAGNLMRRANRPLNVLNLFGYTGVFSLVAASAGAAVTHVDASKKSIAWARENQELSGMGNKPIRWLLDDALKFVEREARRGKTYDGMIIDPPKYGRGPNGEMWKLAESLPRLLQACRAILSPQPVFVILTTYAIRASALSLYYLLDEMMREKDGALACGELLITEKSAGRQVSTSIFARWGAE
jgi:23S rRNA (cytosine1962-C5)-methyltransferase